MDKLKLVDKLRDKANVSYDEAKNVLEINNWDILEAIVYLENIGTIPKPIISVFNTSEYKESYSTQGEVAKVNIMEEEKSDKRENSFEGVFEYICKVIDTGNNIFIEIKRYGNLLLKLPITVMIVLIVFMFWIIIPGVIVALFFDIEFLLSTNRSSVKKLHKINKVLEKLSRTAKDIKIKIIEGLK